MGLVDTFGKFISRMASFFVRDRPAGSTPQPEKQRIGGFRKAFNRVGKLTHQYNMKKVLKFVAERLTGAKAHADHTLIKGRKSGGRRDSNGKDWFEMKGGNHNTSYAPSSN